MNRTSFAALCALSMAAAGCSAYHPASLSPTPWGVAEARDRVVEDRSLAQRYPGSADIAESRFPEGAVTPAPRPAGRDWGVEQPAGWVSTPLQREAERKSIARDLPHASVTPWGTARGH